MTPRKQSHVLWRRLATFNDRAVPKLHNLRVAAAHGLRVPDTWWIRESQVRTALDSGEDIAPPRQLAGQPLILRSGSPHEDTGMTSNAGQYLSLAVNPGDSFVDALKQVASALQVSHTRSDEHMPHKGGVIFAQPLISAISAGVAFFDGYYYERTASSGGNSGLTAGTDRGEVARGQLQRAEAWSAWLQMVWQAFPGNDAIDIEWALTETGYVLLQSRPALFPVKRNRIVSLANHKEIMGDPPSPWITSCLEKASAGAADFFARADPATATWDEPYAIILAERAWMNFSFFFRLMDRWGLPRTMVTESVGGAVTGPADSRIDVKRLLLSAPALIRLQWISLQAIAGIEGRLAGLRHKLDRSDSLPDLHGWCADALELALETNFAINGPLSGITRMRRLLRFPGSPEVVTHRMMAEYEALTSAPNLDTALSAWLGTYGHRGPLESDPCQPRFRELRSELLAELRSRPAAPTAKPLPPRPRSIFAPLFALDAKREWFRNELMRLWERLREKMLLHGEALTNAGVIASTADVFLLRGNNLGNEGSFRKAIETNRQAIALAEAMALPLTATVDEIVKGMTAAVKETDAGTTVFSGVPLWTGVFEGRAVKASGLMGLLGRSSRDPGLLGGDCVLVVPALEPSWAVVFPRVGAVVAEIGGELSHAAILLREAAKPAIVNCQGIYGTISEGNSLRLEGASGIVSVIAETNTALPPSHS